MVTELGFVSNDVTDISPVRALTGLKLLHCRGSDGRAGTLSDLSPLQGMTLTDLNCYGTQVADLSPLRGMELARLTCGYSKVSDLSPLEGMPLVYLDCHATMVSELSSLRGMKLTGLWCSELQVSDLSPLQGMPLRELLCYATKVSDLSPLKGMPITNLNCFSTQISDLSPLQGMNLTDVYVIPKNIAKGLDVIRQMKSLKTIGTVNGGFPPAEFWKKYDAGEFGKPAAPAKLAYLDPAFQQWVKATQALLPRSRSRPSARS